MKRFFRAYGILILIAMLVCFVLLIRFKPRMANLEDNTGSNLVSALPENEEDRLEATNSWKALLWRRKFQVDENGEIPQDGYLRAIEQRRLSEERWKLQAESAAGVLETSWVNRGPQNVGGRTRSMVIDPHHPNVLWAGSVSGGLWKSINSGKTWKPVDDHLANLSISCIAIDPKDSRVMYIGTGEVINGIGILKSTDGGKSWNLLPGSEPPTFKRISRIAISPTDSNVILASTISTDGLFRSTDAGASWQRVGFDWMGRNDVDFHPTDGQRAVTDGLAMINGSNKRTPFFSRDGGLTWTPANSLGGCCFVQELAYSRSNPDIVYLFSGGEVWKSTNGGEKYSKRGVATIIGGNFWYNHLLWVDPTDPDILLVGASNIARSKNGGQTFEEISRGYLLTEQVHPDTHFAIEDPRFDGKTNKRVYIATDGGVFRTENIYTAKPSDDSWDSLNQTFQTTQFYSAAGHGASGFLIGGTQDNGTLALANPATRKAILPLGGDGGFVAVDPRDPKVAYGEFIGLSFFFRTTDGGKTIKFIDQNIDEKGKGNFLAPILLDPNNPDRMLACAKSLWKSDNVRTGNPPNWSIIRPRGSDTLCAVAVAPGNSNIIWVAQNDSKLYKTTNGTSAKPTWKPVAPIPQRFVSRILISHANADTVFVALGGFSDGNLLRTIDGGKTWKDATGNSNTGLPLVPIFSLAQHPQKANFLYVGTEVGIFATENGGESWIPIHKTLANVLVWDLAFLQKSTILVAGTHGRGLWTAKVQ